MEVVATYRRSLPCWRDRRITCKIVTAFVGHRRVREIVSVLERWSLCWESRYRIWDLVSILGNWSPSSECHCCSWEVLTEFGRSLSRLEVVADCGRSLPCFGDRRRVSEIDAASGSSSTSAGEIVDVLGRLLLCY